MNKWVIGARVKTLPAAVSPVLIGTFYASEVNWINALLALIVSLSLQIAVNYANDYSDGIRGTDPDRVGPLRLVASGLASAKSVKRASYISF
jgi:1,4-dihydroxy-2-naphthoate octaprenyltransferase